MAAEWWRFWSANAWREWNRRRGPWKTYTAESSRLKHEIAAGEKQLTSTTAELAAVRQQEVWTSEVHVQDVPVRTAKAETGLAAVAGVSLHGLRKREGKQVWVPVEHGSVYLTDRKLVFSGTKNVEFRYDKITTQSQSGTGLYLEVSNRKKGNMLAGPADKIAALKAPPRPVSPAWLPSVSAAGLLLLIGGLGGAPSNTTPVAGGTTTSQPSAAAMTIPPTPTSTPTTIPQTTTVVTIVSLEDDQILFAPPAPGPSGNPAAALPNAAETATVVAITDGDTRRNRMRKRMKRWVGWRDQTPISRPRPWAPPLTKHVM